VLAARRAEPESNAPEGPLSPNISLQEPSSDVPRVTSQPEQNVQQARDAQKLAAETEKEAIEATIFAALTLDDAFKTRQQELMRSLEELRKSAEVTQRNVVAAFDAYSEEAEHYRRHENEIAEHVRTLQDKVAKLEAVPAKGPGSKDKNDAVKTIRKDECMSRETYARHLRALLGENALEGQHVFHIIANSKGGADHPDNFLYALGSTFNQSISDQYDDLNAFLAGPVKTAKAVRASMTFGNCLDPRGKPVRYYKPAEHGALSNNITPEDEAKRLVAQGANLMRDVRAARRAERQS
jgi:hypothetical protein